MTKLLYPNRIRWNAGTVTWVGFLVFSLVVTAIGMWGGRRVTDLLQSEIVLRGVEHNQAVYRDILPKMKDLLHGSADARTSIERFPETFSAAESLSMSIFLLDRKTGRILAHTNRGLGNGNGRFTLDQLLSQDGMELHPLPLSGDGHDRAVAAVSSRGAPILVYMAPVTDSGYAKDWDLAVQTKMVQLGTTTALLEERVKLLLLTTDILIALFGFIALRRVGRFYEHTLEEKLRQRTADLEASHAQVLQKTTLATIGQTASILAHEMRNPLASIKLSLSSLEQANYLTERDRRRVGIVLRETDRLDGLLSETLDYVRPIHRSPVPIKIDDVLDATLDVLAPLIDSQALRIERIRCPQCPGLRVDCPQLQQALMNLVKNAIEASPRSGDLGIHVQPDGNGWRIHITNQGDMIAEEDMDKIFDTFFTTKPKGTGLGLALVRRVVTEHGGTLSVTSDAASGTGFTLIIPAAGAS